MSYRSDLDALSARHEALAHEVAGKTRELDEARRMLDDAQERARRPVLPNIRVATPCTADWNKMTGDERVRACADCNKNVYNLSDMTREEAEALIIEKEGKLCVRYYQRKDGTILLKDCMVGVAQKRKRRIVAIGASMLLAGGGVIAYKLTRPAERPTNVAMPIQGGLDPGPPPHAITGEVETPPLLEQEVNEVKGDVDISKPHIKMGKIAIHPTQAEL